jgi:hypothetical protein
MRRVMGPGLLHSLSPLWLIVRVANQKHRCDALESVSHIRDRALGRLGVRLAGLAFKMAPHRDPKFTSTLRNRLPSEIGSAHFVANPLSIRVEPNPAFQPIDRRDKDSVGSESVP